MSEQLDAALKRASFWAEYRPEILEISERDRVTMAAAIVLLQEENARYKTPDERLLNYEQLKGQLLQSERKNSEHQSMISLLKERVARLKGHLDWLGWSQVGRANVAKLKAVADKAVAWFESCQSDELKDRMLYEAVETYVTSTTAENDKQLKEADAN